MQKHATHSKLIMFFFHQLSEKIYFEIILMNHFSPWTFYIKPFQNYNRASNAMITLSKSVEIPKSRKLKGIPASNRSLFLQWFAK